MFTLNPIYVYEPVGDTRPYFSVLVYKLGLYILLIPGINKPCRVHAGGGDTRPYSTVIPIHIFVCTTW